jgi:hypothetical protein
MDEQPTGLKTKECSSALFYCGLGFIVVEISKLLL